MGVGKLAYIAAVISLLMVNVSFNPANIPLVGRITITLLTVMQYVANMLYI